MFNPSYYNPAWVGSEDNAFAAVHHRSQWSGYEPTVGPGGPPNTQLLSVVVPVQSTFSGFGASIVNDRQVGLRNNQVRLQFSAKKSLRFGDISIGISPAMNVQTLDPGDFLPSEPEDFGPRQSQTRPNLHAGIYFQSYRRYNIGIAVENIVEPQFDLNGFEQLDYFKRSVNVIASYELDLSRDLILQPSILVRSFADNITGYSMDLSAIVYYQENMWGGLAFRRSESLSLLIGYSFLENNQLKAGYSFDYVIENRDGKQPTSHEIFLRYDLPNLVFGGRKAVKTPRFTF